MQRVEATPRRRAVLLAALLVLTGACTSSADSTTTSTTQAGGSTTSVPATPQITGLPTFPSDNDEIPIDEDVRIGTLANGLTYYIRSNDRPGGRAQLRLAVKAGSLQEAPDQLGNAHFVEHMLFNGTASFPRNELIRVLERFGAEFGPDVNAYTTYEETVYSLELSTDPDILDTGFEVLAEWASAATIDPAEVEAERGVLVEEWRLRSQTLYGRYFDAVAPLLLAGTRYAQRPTLADPATLAATTADGLHRFYEEWYRPELMAVIAVGDFDADTVERTIVERFGDMGNPPETTAPSRVATAPLSEPQVVTIADPESPQTIVELNFPLPAQPHHTIGGLRLQFAMDLAFEMIITRLSEDARGGDTPFIDAGPASNPFVRALETQGLGGLADPVDVLAALEAMLVEVKRAAVHGFSQEEYARVSDQVRGAVEQTYAGRNTTQDSGYAFAYVEHFLGGWPIPDATTQRDVDLQLLNELTSEVIHQIFGVLIDLTEPLVIILGPDSVDLPTDAQLAEVVARVETTTVEPRGADAGVRDALMERPQPSQVVELGSLEPFTDSRVLELANGALVVLLETDISDQAVAFGAASRGGWSLVPDPDVTEAQWATTIITESGIGDLDQIELQRFLAGKVVGVSPYISETEEGLYGGSGTDDAETLLQLIYLYMADPQADEVAWKQILASVRPVAEAPEQIPDLALFAELSDIRFRGHPDYRPYPTIADLETLDVARALALYKERFGNASDFVFVFVGDLPDDEFDDLVSRYIGALPGSGARENWVDDQPEPPAGIQTGTVTAGTGALGSYTRVYTTNPQVEPATYVHARLLTAVLTQRLTDRIREELSATYSPFATVDVTDAPHDTIEVFIQVSGDPAGLDVIESAIDDEIADLRSNGPTADELAISKEQYLRDLELVSNEQIVDQMLFYLIRPNEDARDLTRESAAVRATTIADLREFATSIMPADSYIALDLIPAA